MVQALSLVLAFVLDSPQTPRYHTLHLESDYPVAFTLETLIIDAAGRRSLVESRRLTVDGRTPISFPVSQKHFVKFSAAGVSPHTFSASELSLRQSFLLPQMLPGGELFLVPIPQAVRPSQLEVSGPRSRVLPFPRGPVSVSGLAPGVYGLTPMYEHGIRGVTTRIGVSTGESSIALLPLQQVGAATLRADPEVCRAVTGVAVYRRQGLGDAVPMRRLIAQINEGCPVSVSGLGAGTYEASFRTNTGAVLASAVFDVVPHTVTEVVARGAQVQVEGSASMNGKPLSDATLVFVPTGVGERGAMTATVQTDPSGHYATWLKDATEYSVRLRRNGRTLQTKAVTLERGSNRLDWHVSGGVISVVLTGWDGSMAIDGAVSGAGINQRIVFPPGAPSRLLIEGLATGTYTVSVRPRSRRAQTLVTQIRLDERTLQAEARFDLRRR